MSLQDARSKPFVVAPGQGELTWSLNHLTTLKAGHTQTNGAIGVMEVLVDRNGEPPPHVHHGEDEAFYVLEGKVTVYVGDEVLDAPTGAFVFAPRDVPHRFSVDSQQATLLVLMTPGGFEEFFAEVGEPAPAARLPQPGRPDLARVAEAAGRHHCEILMPPA